MPRLLTRRGLRSLAVAGIALGLLLLGSSVCLTLQWLGRRLFGGWAPRVPLWLPAGLPLPIAGFAVFALVLRLVPPGHALDYDRAGLFWAGLVLLFADGVGRTLLNGMRSSLESELDRKYSETQDLWGLDARRAAAEVSAGVRASQVRGAVLAMFGGLIVVEAIFGINGLGETLKDLVVDHQGLDPLLLCGVLLLFTAGVVAIQLAPLERLVVWWRPS